MAEKITERNDKDKIVTKARVCKLLCEGESFIACVYDGTEFQEYGFVILCSGSFGADVSSSNSLLAQTCAGWMLSGRAARIGSSSTWSNWSRGRMTSRPALG